MEYWSKRVWPYLLYLWVHKKMVWVYGRKLQVPIWRLVIHDWSKFLPVEFFPYLDWFYGPKEERDEQAFNRAWLHHIHKQDHHWQHWLLQKDDWALIPLEMPDRAVREMAADWVAAAYAQGRAAEIWSWYLARGEQFQKMIHSGSRTDLEIYLSVLQERPRSSL